MTLSIEEYHEKAMGALERAKTNRTQPGIEAALAKARVYAELAKTAQAAEPEVDTLLKGSLSQSPAAEDPELMPHGARYAADEKIVALLRSMFLGAYADGIIETFNAAGLYVVEVPE